MAQVAGVPLQFAGYYRSASPRCSSPQPPYRQSSSPVHFDRRDLALDSRTPYQSFPIRRATSPQPPSSISSSPELPSVLHSTQSSSTSSAASSICLDDPKSIDDFDTDDALFPVYEYESPSPSPEPTRFAETKPIFDGLEEAEMATETSPEFKACSVAPADDNFVRHEPSKHVDYLSHEWKEEDIWASWRYMVGKRNQLSNAERLENASWRQWGKAKYNLKTVSPEKLNWLKDCDVTWLYGPLSTARQSMTVDYPYSPPASPSGGKSTVETFFTAKPILKKRSMSEIMLQRSLSNSSLLKQATAALESQNLGSNWESAPSNLPSPSLTASCSGPGLLSAVASTGLTSRLSTGCHSPNSKKHIHFNDSVQQCIALDKDDDEYDDDSDCEDEVEDAVNGESSDEETRGRSRSRSRSRDRKPRSPQTIAMLPSTSLKYVETPPPPPPTKSSFMSLNSFFSSPRPTPPPPTSKPTIATRTYILEDDDDLADLGWQPSSPFGNKRDSSTPVGRKNDASFDSSDDDDFQLPNYSYDEEEDPADTGIIGRAVDAVNTARDIAHVLWNVGWTR